jgi:hypothetical protein
MKNLKNRKGNRPATIYKKIHLLKNALGENPIFKATNITNNKTMIPIFLIFSIKTSHKLFVRKVLDLLSSYFRK